MRRVRTGRVVRAIEVDEMAAFLEWLDVEVTAELVRLVPARLITKEDLQRVRRHTRLEQPRGGDSAIAPVHSEGEPADALGGAILCARRTEGELPRLGLEGQDETVRRIVRIPPRRERRARHIGSVEVHGRSHPRGAPEAIAAETHEPRP